MLTFIYVITRDRKEKGLRLRWSSTERDLCQTVYLHCYKLWMISFVEFQTWTNITWHRNRSCCQGMYCNIWFLWFRNQKTQMQPYEIDCTARLFDRPHVSRRRWKLASRNFQNMCVFYCWYIIQSVLILHGWRVCLFESL